MVSVLIVDDDARKVGLIQQVLKAVPIADDIRVDVASSANSAGERLSNQHYQLLILDLNLPIREGEDAKQNGGEFILDYFDVNPDVVRPTHIIGLTSYSNLEQQFRQRFASEGWMLIHFANESSGWSNTLARRLIHIVESQYAINSSDYKTDVCLVTALYTPELEQILCLPAGWSDHEVTGDESKYYKGRFSRGNKSLEIVASSAVDMGMPSAVALSMKMIDNFRPRYLVMTGIAAGVKGNYGDILVADQSWDYGSGKSKYILPLNCAWLSMFGRVAFEPAPAPLAISPVLKSKLGAFGLKHASILKAIRNGWPADKALPMLSVQIGPIGSGAAVLQNAPLIDEIKRNNRKLVGVEMETYGLFVAARLAKAPRPLALSIKSICDFGDHRKDDDWQCYAAYTSAKYFYEFAIDQLAMDAI